MKEVLTVDQIYNPAEQGPCERSKGFVSDIEKGIWQNMDKAIMKNTDIDKEILENINIHKELLESIDIDKMSN